MNTMDNSLIESSNCTDDYVDKAMVSVHKMASRINEIANYLKSKLSRIRLFTIRYVIRIHHIAPQVTSREECNEDLVQAVVKGTMNNVSYEVVSTILSEYSAMVEQDIANVIDAIQSHLGREIDRDAVRTRMRVGTYNYYNNINGRCINYDDELDRLIKDLAPSHVVVPYTILINFDK